MRSSLFVSTASAALAALFLNAGAMAQDEQLPKQKPLQGGATEQTTPAKPQAAEPKRVGQADCQAGAEANCPPKKPKMGAQPAETVKPKVGQQDVQEPAKAGEATPVKPKLGQKDVQEPAKTGQATPAKPEPNKVGQADCQGGDQANCPPKKPKMGAQPGDTTKPKVGQQDVQEPAKAGEVTPTKPKVGQQDVQEPGKPASKTGAATPEQLPATGTGTPANPTQTGQNGAGDAGGKVEVTGNIKIAPDRATRVRDTLFRTGERSEDIDVTINIGTPLPERARPRPLPTTIIEIAPEYRGYDYVIVRDEIVIVEPSSRKVVEVIHQGSRVHARSSTSGPQLQLTTDQRAMILDYARQQRIAAVQERIDLDTGANVPSDVNLVPLPDEIVTQIPAIRTYSFFVVSDQVVLVDPQSRQVVEVVE